MGVGVGGIFAGYVPLTSQIPYLIMVCSWINCRLPLSHFTKTITIFLQLIFPFLNL